MDGLKGNGSYSITEEMAEKLKDFEAGFATEEDTAGCIRRVYEKTGYVLDTHTAVAAYVCEQYQSKSKDLAKCVVASTASPYKFAKSVMTAIDGKYENAKDFELLNELESVSGVDMPQAIKDILDAKIVHTLECDSDKMKETVKTLLCV